MRKRIKKYATDIGDNISISTIHAFCLQYIISPFARLYLEKEDFPSNFRIASNSEVNEAFNFAKNNITGADIVTQLEMNAERKKNVGGLSRVNPPTYDLALKVAKVYENKLHKAGLIDFEDIVNYSVKILRE